MTKKEMHSLESLRDSIFEMDKNNLKLRHKVEQVINVLEDDSHSTRTGLITQVSKLNDDVEKLMHLNTALRRVSIFFVSILTAVITFAIKSYFFGDK
jgi:hypothetical protein